MSNQFEFFFKKKLSSEELNKIKQFYDSLDMVTIEQHPDWSAVVDNKKDCQYFFASENSKLKCFAIITHQNYSLFKTAVISFGPVFSDSDSLIVSIKKIIEEYKKKHYFYLSIQLAMPVGSDSEYIDYKLNQTVSIQYAYDRYNWTSLVVDLSDSIETINKRFSKGHKSAIKKSIADGTYVKPVTNKQDTEALAKIYKKMNVARRRANEDGVKVLFNNIFEFLTQNDKGVILNVYDVNNVLVGGIIVIYQGNTARYYKGASDPERKDVAVLHLALFEAFKISKERGLANFDLWGYNHFVDDKDQIFYINRFKKGFSDNYLFYPKTMHISLKKCGFFIFRIIRSNLPRIKFVFNLLKGKIVK